VVAFAYLDTVMLMRAEDMLPSCMQSTRPPSFHEVERKKELVVGFAHPILLGELYS
jgi:hypothetical protein